MKVLLPCGCVEVSKKAIRDNGSVTVEGYECECGRTFKKQFWIDTAFWLDLAKAAVEAKGGKHEENKR